jgi:hypothetical protein
MEQAAEGRGAIGAPKEGGARGAGLDPGRQQVARLLLRDTSAFAQGEEPMNKTKRSAWRACLFAAGVVLGLQAQAQSDDPAQRACPPNPTTPTQASVQQASAAARDRGFLWRIERDGRTSWLYGTLHIGRFEWIFPGPQVRAALQGSRSIALELDLTDAATVQQFQQLSAAMPVPPLTDDLQRRLAAQAERACLPPQQAAALHPLMQGITYTLLDARWDDLHAAWAQEVMLAGLAKRTGRPVIALETPQTQVEALFTSDATEALRRLEQMLEQLESGKPRQQMLRLATAWERGDLGELENFEQWCECIVSDEDRQMMQRLQTDRNPGLAARIEQAHAEGEVFAAVGALHLTGPQGLPALLQARGFAVERVVFEPAPAAQ